MSSSDNFPDAGDVPDVAISYTYLRASLSHTSLREGTSSECQIVDFKLTGLNVRQPSWMSLPAPPNFPLVALIAQRGQLRYRRGGLMSAKIPGRLSFYCPQLEQHL